jgi:nucleoside-diphosphate-sugar epimerase
VSVAGPVLITGGAGFIGATLAAALTARGRDVVTLDVKPLGDEAAFILGDGRTRVSEEPGSVDSWPAVMDAVARHRPQEIVHIAAITNPVAIERDAGSAMRVNVQGTLNVLEAARISGVRRVVYFSSIGALTSVHYEPIDANHPVIAATEGPGSGFYGASKVAAEAFGLAFVTAHGLDVRIIRPSAVYGFGMQWPIYIKPMVEGAVRGEPVRFAAGGSFPRDYTHVDDVAALAAALLEAPDEADRVFYAATGEPLITAGDVAQVVRELIPGADIEIADGLSEADQLEIRYRGRLSIENAKTQLSWLPRYSALRDGIADYIERYRAFLTRG